MLLSVVQPIKDQVMLEKIKEYLREQSTRNYLLFRMGINLGLPVNDLLQLRAEEVIDQKDFLYGNYRLHIGESLQKEISFYLGERKKGFLFRVQQDKPLSRFQLYNIIKEAADAVGFNESVGAMTLRKTFAYWAYKKQKLHLPLLSKYLGHHTVKYTLRYINEPENKKNNEVILPDLDI